MARPIHKALATPGQVRILFHSQASDRYKKWMYVQACCQLDVCMCMQIEQIYQSTYVTAYENKIEFNYPAFFCCCLVSACGLCTA